MKDSKNEIDDIVDKYKQSKIRKSEEAACKTRLMSEIKRAACIIDKKPFQKYSGKDCIIKSGLNPDENSFRKE